MGNKNITNYKKNTIQPINIVDFINNITNDPKTKKTTHLINVDNYFNIKQPILEDYIYKKNYFDSNLLIYFELMVDSFPDCGIDFVCDIDNSHLLSYKKIEHIDHQKSKISVYFPIFGINFLGEINIKIYLSYKSTQDYYLNLISKKKIKSQHEYSIPKIPIKIYFFESGKKK